MKIATTRNGPFRYFTCSCGRGQAANPLMPWCAGCGVEYDIRSRAVILRPNKKTPRFAVAKAWNLAGGTGIAGMVNKEWHYRSRDVV